MSLRLIPHNGIMKTDGYKPSHWPQYPKGLVNLYSYGESRGGVFPEVTFQGLQYILVEHFSTPISMADIDYAERRLARYFGTERFFNRAGWEHIVREHDGLWPLRIKAVPEGTTVPVRNILFSIENTCEHCAWVTNYVETLLSHVWYSTTVCTRSREMKKLILRYLAETGDEAGIDWKLHDFGYRGVSCDEQAAVGGLAHLVNFKGTDTLIALEMAMYYYDEEMAGGSIPAAEHSTITAWGKEFEFEAYRNMIKAFGDGPPGMYAVVSDSYDLYNAVKNGWCGDLKEAVLAAPNVLVVRPDSGEPNIIVRQTVEMLADGFGYTVNAKGYKVLNKVRVIQGDGISYEEVGRILEALKVRGWSADNVAFGSGGYLLMQVNRDTQKFAVKAAHGTFQRDGGGYFERNIQKTPVTDPGKWSKAGRQKLVRDERGVLQTVPADQMGHDVLELVYENGVILRRYTLQEIRDNAVVHSDSLALAG